MQRLGSAAGDRSVAAGTEVHSMRTIRRGAAIPLVVISLALAACSSGAATLSTVGNAVPAAGSGEDTSGYGGAQAAASAAPSSAPAPAPSGGAQGDVANVVDDAKIIRTGTIELEVSDVAKAVTTARDGIRSLGGYISASNTANTKDDQPTATVTYRIPADKWEQALDLLRGLNGYTTKVAAEHTEAVEVTGQVIDLQARISNLQASESALQAIARRAVRVSDVLEVQSQLTSVRGDIEVLSGQLKDLNDRASYATLTADFNLPVVAVELAKKGWDPSAVVDEASASLIDILQGVVSAGIWFGIVWLPVLLTLGVVVGIVAWVLRRARRLGAPRAGTSTPTV